MIILDYRLRIYLFIIMLCAVQPIKAQLIDGCVRVVKKYPLSIGTLLLTTGFFKAISIKEDLLKRQFKLVKTRYPEFKEIRDRMRMEIEKLNQEAAVRGISERPLWSRFFEYYDVHTVRRDPTSLNTTHHLTPPKIKYVINWHTFFESYVGQKDPVLAGKLRQMSERGALWSGVSLAMLIATGVCGAAAIQEWSR